MARRHIVTLSLIFNATQILAITLLNVHSIWFDRYEDRNVGPGVVYAFYTFGWILLMQLANFLLWIATRKNRAEARLVLRSAWATFAATAFFTWLGEQFMYAGTR